MLNKKFIINSIGLILVFESLFMLLSLLVGLIYHEQDLSSMGISFLITFITGGTCYLSTRKVEADLIKREGVIVVVTVWLVISIFGCLPYIISGYIPRFTDAFFETISGFTTTGASVLSDIEALPKSLLFWRSLTHLLGGMGIVVLAVAILPFVGFGGMHLFSAESVGVPTDKLHPRVKQTAKSLWVIYISLVGLETIFLVAGKMPLFDALCHSFGTLASGGFGTKNDSITSYSPYIQYVIIVFMLFAGTNFALFYFAFKGKWRKLWDNHEFRFYIGVVFAVSAFIALVLFFKESISLEKAFRDALFQVSSIITSTGFATADYTQWPTYLTFTIFLLMFLGASSGSTSGGIKLMRHYILFKNIHFEFKRISHPMAIVPVKVAGKVVPTELIYKTKAFIMLYLTTFAIGALLLTVVGMDMDSAMGASATCMGGIGPGLGTVGPASNFGAVPEMGKWILSGLMLLGRLELFSVLILFSARFWKDQ